MSGWAERLIVRRADNETGVRLLQVTQYSPPLPLPTPPLLSFKLYVIISVALLPSTIFIGLKHFGELLKIIAVSSYIIMYCFRNILNSFLITQTSEVIT